MAADHHSSPHDASHGAFSAGTSLMTIEQPPAQSAPVGFYGPLPPPEILTQGFDPLWLWHSFRRRWVLAVGL